MIRGLENMINRRFKEMGLFSLEKRGQKEEMTTGFKYEGRLKWTVISCFPS